MVEQACLCAARSLSFLFAVQTKSKATLKDTSHQTEWEKVVVTNRKCSNMLWVFFFSIQRLFETYTSGTYNWGKRTYPLKNTRLIRYFWHASFPLERNVTWLIHVCPTFYVRQEICIPSATCQRYCFYLRLQMLFCSSNKQILKCFHRLMSSVKFGEFKKYQKQVKK